MKRVFVGMVAGLLLVNGAVFAEEWNCDQLFLSAVKADDLEDTEIHLHHNWGNVNVKDKGTGETALIIAAKNGNADIVRLLLNVTNVTTNVNAQDNTGKTALIVAAERNSNVIMRLLLGTARGSGVEVNLQDGEDMTALMYCVKTQFAVGVDLILQKSGAEINNQTAGERLSPLHYAVKRKSVSMISLLLEKPLINVLLVDGSRKTAFMLAIEDGDINLINAFYRAPSFDITKQPIDPEVPPALLWAIREHLPYSTIRAILRFNNAIFTKDKDGKTALDYLDRYDRNDTELRKLLTDTRDAAAGW